ncbi:MAG: FAD-dependent oxidoreductase [Deinococcales bacterium]
MSVSPATAVAVVGGGIAGLSLTYALARRGCPVVVFERGRIGAQGASSGPAALLNPHRGHSARAHEQDLAGLAAFWQLAARLEEQGFDAGAARSGVLRIAPSERRARAWRRLPGVRWLEPDEVPAPYRAPHGALLAEDGGWLRPGTLLAALRDGSRAFGAEVREGVRVLRLEPAPGGVRLITSAGPASAAHVALCVGADASPELPLPPLRTVAGDVVEVATDALSATPSRPLGGSVYAAFADGRGFVGGSHRDPEVPDPEGPKRLLQRLDAVLPGIGTATGLSLWSGVRAQASTPRPLVTELEPGVAFFGALSGRGFLCSADLAERLAERLARAIGV